MQMVFIHCSCLMLRVIPAVLREWYGFNMCDSQSAAGLLLFSSIEIQLFFGFPRLCPRQKNAKEDRICGWGYPVDNAFFMPEEAPEKSHQRNDHQ